MIEPTSDARIKVPDSTVSSVIGRGLGGEITGKVGRIQSLHLGNFKLDRAIANFPDPNSYFDTLKVGSTMRNGAIGGEVLSRFTVVFNFPKEKIYLKKNSQFKKPFHYNLSGITVKAKGSRLNVFEVTEVRKKSAGYRAGILEGDIIVTINGIATKVLELNHINGIFNNKPGKKINLVLDRNGQKVKTSMQLKDQI
jgi:membrane-associated protease RseP (regulator of RpoE activity)